MTRFLHAARALALAFLVLAATAIPVAMPTAAGAVGIGPTGLNINATIQGKITNVNPLGSSLEDVNQTFGLQFTGGTGAGQVDTFYAAQITIAASGTATLDLNGSVTDAFGNSVVLLHVKMIALIAAAGNTNDCQIGPGASNPFAGPWSGTTPLTAVSPGETYLITKGQGAQAGWPVTASTGDIVKLANSSSGTSVTCTVFVAGTST